VTGFAQQIFSPIFASGKLLRDSIMNDASATARKPGRPPIPRELHRRTVTVRLRPELLADLTKAAATRQHSLSQEIEFCCQAYLDLVAASRRGPVLFLAQGDAPVAEWTAREHVIGSLAAALIRLPHHSADGEGDEQ
jgi:hypothetical protein